MEPCPEVTIDTDRYRRTFRARTGTHRGASRCALLRHTGSDDQLGRSILHLYSQWLPGCGEEPRNFPLFMQRVTFFPDAPDNDAITDIYLPLA